MRRVKFKGAPPGDWLSDAEVVTRQLKAASTLTITAGDYTLCLLPAMRGAADLPVAGAALLAIGDLNGLLRLRAFDAAGTKLADVEQAKREPDHSPLLAMRDLLEGNWNAARLKPFEKRELFKIASAIIQRATIDGIIKDNEKLWQDDRIRDWLLDQFNNKCWYSESQDAVSSIHVDHYRPKGRITDDLTGATSDGYWWQAFKWENYKMCGQLLNVKKRDIFPFADTTRARPNDPATLHLESPVLIDPCTEDSRLISFDLKDEESCEAVVAGGLQPDQADRATRTIEILGLNRLPRLNSKRAQFWKDCRMEIANYRGAAGPQCLKLVAQAGARAKLRKMVTYEAEFSSVAEACIRKLGPDPLVASVFSVG
jgi:hypothetical protein